MNIIRRLDNKIYNRGQTRAKKHLREKFEPILVFNWKKYKYTDLDASTTPALGFRFGTYATNYYINVLYETATDDIHAVIYDGICFFPGGATTSAIYTRIHNYFHSYVSCSNPYSYTIDCYPKYHKQVWDIVTNEKYIYEIDFMIGQALSMLPENRRERVDQVLFYDMAKSIINDESIKGTGRTAFKPFYDCLVKFLSDNT